MKRNGSITRGTRRALVVSGTVLAIACSGGPNAPPAAATGTIAFSVDALGNAVDPDGVTITIAGWSGVLQFGKTLIARNLKPGTYTAAMSGVASHCFATQQQQTVSVVVAQTTTVKFAIECYGDIAFVRHYSTTNLQIFYLNLAGAVVPLTPNLAGRNFLEAWSPDGTRVMFTNEYNDNTEIYTVKSDGSGLTRVTTNPRHDLSPRWSPDGRQIVFHRRMNLANNYALHVVNADGSNERLLLDTLSHDMDPAWSPDGSQIAFSCDRFGLVGAFDICTVAPDGSRLRRITSVGDAFFSGWSPDASRLGYRRSLSNPRIWVAKLDGGPPVDLTPQVKSFELAWSPDGARLLLSIDDGSTGLATVNGDGTNYVRLPVTIVSGYADWSRDGTKVVADVMLASRRVVAVMNPDGSGVRALEPIGSVAAYRALWNPKTRLVSGALATN